MTICRPRITAARGRHVKRVFMRFSRDLKYLGTLKPFPGDFPYEKLEGAAPIRINKDKYVPRVYHIYNLGVKEHYPDFRDYGVASTEALLHCTRNDNTSSPCLRHE